MSSTSLEKDCVYSLVLKVSTFFGLSLILANHPMFPKTSSLLTLSIIVITHLPQHPHLYHLLIGKSCLNIKKHMTMDSWFQHFSFSFSVQKNFLYINQKAITEWEYKLSSKRYPITK